MVSQEPEQTERRSKQNKSENNVSPPPVQLLKKTRAETSTKPSRQQRDATPMPKRLVDLDVNSPELTIMDDYLGRLR
jgi:hypothetical protein